MRKLIFLLFTLAMTSELVALPACRICDRIQSIERGLAHCPLRLATPTTTAETILTESDLRYDEMAALAGTFRAYLIELRQAATIQSLADLNNTEFDAFVNFIARMSVCDDRNHFIESLSLDLHPVSERLSTTVARLLRQNSEGSQAHAIRMLQTMLYAQDETPKEGADRAVQSEPSKPKVKKAK